MQVLLTTILAASSYNPGMIIISMVIGGAIGAAIGNSKNRLALGAILGALLGCIGWIIVAVLPKNDGPS